VSEISTIILQPPARENNLLLVVENSV
jgi:hypothetical protein